jgi:hypothetical protein
MYMPIYATAATCLEICSCSARLSLSGSSSRSFVVTHDAAVPSNYRKVYISKVIKMRRSYPGIFHEVPRPFYKCGDNWPTVRCVSLKLCSRKPLRYVFHYTACSIHCHCRVITYAHTSWQNIYKKSTWAESTKGLRRVFGCFDIWVVDVLGLDSICHCQNNRSYDTGDGGCMRKMPG